MVNKYSSAAAAAMLALFAGQALAQEAENVPPANAVKLSEIIAKVEARDGFRYIDEIDWDDKAYTVTYYTTDKAKVEISFDPATGQPK